MIVVSLLSALSILAGAYDGPDRARLLLLSADSCAFAITMKPLATDAAESAKYDEDRKKALAGIEEDGPVAIKAAGNSAEQQIAIKDFYNVADSYCKNPTSAGKADFKAKEKALDSLLEAAGR